MRLSIIDSTTLAGHPDRPNEDRAGFGDGFVFVIDGATSLGPNFITSKFDSDAAWIAEFAKVHLEYMLPSGRPVNDVVSDINGLAKSIVDFAADGKDIPAWQQPIAGFQMVRIENGHLVTHGLGDCVLMICGNDGAIQRFSAHGGNHISEKERARRGISAKGGLVSGEPLPDVEALLEAERQIRAGFNCEGADVWTLGTAAQAGAHLVSEIVTVATPAIGLLMSDGFSALVDKYDRYDASSLISEATRLRSVKHLAAELRHVETVEDPRGEAFPRMKVSDDATAILFQVKD